MYHFIVNPCSRSRAGEKIWRLLQSRLDREKIPYRSYMTAYMGHAVSLSRTISLKGTAEQPVYIIAVGGDGTICEVLSGIADLEAVIFGYIPTGSGNDFCRGMQLPRSPLEALDVILREERIVPMDVPSILDETGKSRFSVSAGIGFDAAICQSAAVTPLKKILNRFRVGSLVYLFTAVKQLLLSDPSAMDLTVDGKTPVHYPRVYFVTVMNQKYEGGGFCFCPGASPFDRSLDVLVAEGGSRMYFLVRLLAVFFRKHGSFKGIHIFRCHNITIKSDLALPVHKDGEAFQTENEFSVSLEEKTLKVIMPVL